MDPVDDIHNGESSEIPDTNEEEEAPTVDDTEDGHVSPTHMEAQRSPPAEPETKREPPTDSKRSPDASKRQPGKLTSIFTSKFEGIKEGNKPSAPAAERRNFRVNQTTDDICCCCNKKVYQMEKLIADKVVYHKTCFKCFKCKRTLSLGNFSTNNNELYCKPHFLELFKMRGHYDDKRLVVPVGGVQSHTESENGTHRSNGDKSGSPDIQRGPPADVVRCDDPINDEKPPACYTKNIVARFREIEAHGDKKTSDGGYTPEKDQLPAANTAKSMAAVFTAMGSKDGSPPTTHKARDPIKINDEIDQSTGCTSENEPQIREGVVRSGQPGLEECQELPEQGTTKNLLARFQNLQASS